MKKSILCIAVSIAILLGMHPVYAAEVGDTTGGTWGGIDWTFVVTDAVTGRGTLTISPTAGTPVPDAKGRTYEVGQWREAVIYSSKNVASTVEGWPYDRLKVTKLIIEEGVTSIGSFTAQSMINLTGEIVIPSTVKYIGQEAFSKTPATKLTFAPGGTEPLCIANGAFKYMKIEKLELPERTAHVHCWIFGGNINLKEVYIPAGVTEMWGSNHIDYNPTMEEQLNPSWAHSSAQFNDCSKVEKFTFGSEEAKELFYKYDNSYVENKLGGYVGLTGYTDLQDAIDAAAESGLPVVLEINVTVAGDIVIPAGVTVDLNGKTLTNTGNIRNEGTIGGSGTFKNNGEYGKFGNGIIADTVTFTGTGVSCYIFTYGDTDAAVYAEPSEQDGVITYAVTEGDCIEIDENTGEITVLSAGEAVVSVTETGAEGSEELLKYKVEIEKADLVIRADNKTAFRGGELPGLTYKVFGLINGDELDTEPTLSTDAVTSEIGTFEIIIGGAEAENYNITYENAVLTVSEFRPSFDVPPAAVNTVQTPGGTVGADCDAAHRGDIVTVTAVPDEGFEAMDITVTDAFGGNIEVLKLTEGEYSFVMPGSSVEIRAKFEKTDCSENENCSAKAFTDIEDAAWYSEGVHFCLENGIMQGVSDDRFDPLSSISRAMTVTVLWRLEGCPVTLGDASFKDVAEDMWYTEAIRWAAEAGIIEGVGDGSFGVGTNITREQLAVILWRYAAWKGLDVSEAPETPDYTDAGDISEWAEEAMGWACGMGIIGADEESGENTLLPGGEATRARAAVMLHRFCEIFGE